MKLLLVDDDEFVRDSLGLMFESRGCSLRVVESAEEAITILDEQSYDIVITDYRLPGMDGLKFCRWMQQTHPRCLKILITAYGSRTLESEALSIGVNQFIEKPITSEAIESSLASLFNETL